VIASTFAQEEDDYQSYVREIEARWAEAEQKRFEAFQREEARAFQNFLNQEETAYRQYVEEIQRKWNEFLSPSRKQWVDYSDDTDTRTIVNFEEKEQPEDTKGQITVETLVLADEPNLLDKAKMQIEAQVKKFFAPKPEEAAETPSLEGQVKTQKGEPVTPENVKTFVQEEILPQAKVDPEPIPSKDGVERVKVTVTIPMVPEHPHIRAEKFLVSIRKYSEQHQVEVPLVLAIIHTESSFNPLAKSHIPAFGLMQIVPKYGGLDAYRYLFKENKMPTSRFLYDADNNLLLGTAYIHILKEQYLFRIKDPIKREYLMIAAYNGGIGRVLERVVRQYNVSSMSPSEVYDVLIEKMPNETKGYLKKVTLRKEKYIAWR
jgi:membrane-bound lytic murein transglycosylase C